MAAVTIASGAVLGAIFANTVSSHQRVWEVGTDLYTVVVETADGDPHVYKSTDSGASWSVQDAANAPNGLNTDASVYTFDSFIRSGGTILRVVYRSATNTLTVACFNTSTDLWTTALGNATTAAAASWNVRIVERSDGDVIVSYTSSADTADLMYARYEGSWTSNVVILSASSPSNSVLVESVIDSADRIYFFFIDIAATDFSYISLSSANSLETLTDIDTSIAAQTAAASFEIYDVAGTETVTATIANSTVDIDAYVVSLESASGSGNIAAEEANIHTGTDLGRNVMGTFLFDGDRYIFWSDDNEDDLLYISNTGSGWGTAASNQTTWQTLTGPTKLGFAGNLLGGVYVTWEENGAVYGDWFIAPASGDAFLTVGAATAAAAGEAVTLDAASRLTVTEAAAPAAGQAVVLKGQGTLAVTEATAPAAGEAVTLDAASIFTVAAATAPAAGEAVTLTGQGRLAVTEATAPAQGEAVTFDAAALFTIGTALAPAQGEAVNLAAAAAASLVVDAASAPAAADSTLTGQARLAVTEATAPAAGEDVTFVAAARFIVDDAEAPAQGEAVTLTAGAAASLTVTPATATADGEAVTLDAAAVLTAGTAEASAQGEDVTLDVAARLIAGTAEADADAQDVTIYGQGVLGVTEATAPADGENVTLFGGTSIPASLTVAPATAPAQGETVNLTAGAVFLVGVAAALAQGEAVTLDAAAIMVVSPATASAAGQTVGLIGQAVLTVTPTDAAADADGAFTAEATMTLTPAEAAAEAGTVVMFGTVPFIPTTVVFDRDVLSAIFSRELVTATASQSGPSATFSHELVTATASQSGPSVTDWSKS